MVEPAGGPAVRVEELAFQYQGGGEVLRGISFTLEPGDFLVVLGANGAGKSTLCYLLTGIVPNIYAGRRSGTVEVVGVDPWEYRLAELTDRVGLVMQNPESQISMPIVEMEMGLALANRAVPAEEIGRRVEWALEVVDLAGYRRRPTKALSGGQKQRLVLGAALTSLPPLLVLDEPTAQLDPLGSRELLRAISKLRQERRVTIVMTTHKTEEVLGLATHALVLEEGRAVAYGPYAEVMRQVDLLEAAGVQAPPAEHIAWRVRRRGVALPPGAAEEAVVEALRSRARGPVPVPRRERPAATRAPVLELEHVTFRYPGQERPALQDVSLRVGEGEFVGVVGQNGSGKSTLLKLLAGLIRPQEGGYRLAGRETAPLSVAEIARQLGLVLQDPDYQLFNPSGLEEVAFGLRNQRLPEEEVLARSRAALAAVRLEAQAELFPFRMSFGDRRKLAVAAVLALEPKVLVLDEPTTAQDYRGRYLLADLAAELRARRGHTVLMVSHDIDLVARYVDRLVVMRDGRITVDAPLEEALAQEDELRATHVSVPTVTRIARRSGVFDGLVADEESLLAAFPGGERREHAL